MNGPGRLRQRRPEDLPGLVLILRQVHEADGYPSAWPADPLSFVRATGVVEAWIAEAEGRPLGQVVLCEPGRGTLQTLVPGALEIKRLFVGSEGRGSGLAADLMARAHAGAQALERPAALQVDPRNTAALALYRKLGWQPVATAEAPWLDPDGRAPMVEVLRAPAFLNPT
ncbi:GNAT family N-acetyltransferase [Deinococcus navajonensis]|uniref:GNAT family N-acetyltransferase n=1 Tax=Deinococcus navajonensis TaxID=309884 RepID=A0ABV8XMT1_9DEIO